MRTARPGASGYRPAPVTHVEADRGRQRETARLGGASAWSRVLRISGSKHVVRPLPRGVEPTIEFRPGPDTTGERRSGRPLRRCPRRPLPDALQLRRRTLAARGDRRPGQPEGRRARVVAQAAAHDGASTERQHPRVGPQGGVAALGAHGRGEPGVQPHWPTPRPTAGPGRSAAVGSRGGGPHSTAVRPGRSYRGSPDNPLRSSSSTRRPGDRGSPDDRVSRMATAAPRYLMIFQLPSACRQAVP